MYTPLMIAQIMDIRKQPFHNRWTEVIKETLKENDEVMSFVWYDTDFLNPSYTGKYQYINDVLLKHRSQMYKAMTGKAEIPKDPIEDRALAAELFASYLVPNKWAANKQVYKFDAELELSLAESEDIKLPVRVLDRLPYGTFYIDFADNGIFKSNFHGAFINIVPHGQGYLLYIERIKEDGRVMFGHVALIPDNKDGVFFFNRENVSPENEADRNKDWQEFGFFLLNALLYLCADNAEIKESEVTKRTYRKSNSIKNKFSEIKQWECGYRYGASIHSKKAEQTSAKTNDETGLTSAKEEQARSKRTIVAHTRRAHWHHYWVGPRDGERKLILHWIPPTYVTGQQTEVAVIHNIRI